jgi:hypothetical protein
MDYLDSENAKNLHRAQYTFVVKMCGGWVGACVRVGGGVRVHVFPYIQDIRIVQDSYLFDLFDINIKFLFYI